MIIKFKIQVKEMPNTPTLINRRGEVWSLNADMTENDVLEATEMFRIFLTQIQKELAYSPNTDNVGGE